MFTTSRSTLQRRGYSHQVIALLTLVIALTAGCKSPTGPSEPNPTNSITLGTKVAVSTQSIGGSGGSITVAGSGTKLDGLVLSVPSGSYAASKTFVVSYAPITGSNLNSNLVPLTPMISIQNGGGYAKSPMNVKIPITLPTGSFAAAFFYNESTGELELIPVDTESSTSITISTKHFSTSTLTSSASYRKGMHITDVTSYSDIIVLAMDDTKLFTVGDQTSGFTPGTDDWEFTNYGSYIAPGGHCAGQSVSAMWYYCQEKKTLNHQLYNYLNPNTTFPTTDMPSGNRLGYRFASEVQSDLDFTGGLQAKIFQSWNPPLTFKLFLLGMYVSKQPQYIGLLRSSDSGGHAMVCYGVNYTDNLNGTLLIEDPNHPGESRTINYVNGQFQPYVTGLRADGNAVSFNVISALAKTAYIDWDQIGQRWSEVEAKTIGDGDFPNVTLQYYNTATGSYLDLPSNLTIESDTIHLVWNPAFAIYNINGTALHTVNGALALQYGRNILGFNFRDKPLPDTNREWVDFIWDTIYSNQLVIDPQTMTGQPGVSYTWSCSAGSLPNSARYEWDFGDGTSKVVNINEGSASHTYSQSGLYTITLSLYDNSTNVLQGKATATATMGGLWNLLHQQNGFQIYLQSTFNYSDGSQTLTNWTIPEQVASYAPITWKDTTFSANMGYLAPSSTRLYYDSEICTIKAIFLSDGITLKSMTFYDRVMSVSLDSELNPQQTDERIRSLTVSNAVSDVYDPTGQYLPPYLWSSDIGSLVSNVVDKETTVYYPAGGSPITTVKSLTSVSWGASGFQSDALHFVFTKN